QHLQVDSGGSLSTRAPGRTVAKKGTNMNFDAYKTIKFERRDRVLYVIFNRPDVLNAVDEQMHEELARVFRDCSEDTDSDLIVLTGEGRAFCAGGDIDWMQDAIDVPARFEKTAREAKQIVYTL